MLRLEVLGVAATAAVDVVVVLVLYQLVLAF